MASSADSMEVMAASEIGCGGDGTKEGHADSSSVSSEGAKAVSAGAAPNLPDSLATAGQPAPSEELTKVTVFNVGLHATLAQFEKILRKNGVEYKRAKKTPSISHGVLTFETAEQRSRAMAQVGKLVGARGGELMYAVLANPGAHKRGEGRDDNRGDGGWKRARQDEESKKTVAQATASLYGVKTYAEQLAFKEKTLMDDLFLRLPAMIRNEWDKRFRDWKRNQRAKEKQEQPGKLSKPVELRCPAWCRMFRRRDGTVPFEVHPIVPSPEQEGYRNKCEFTLSLSANGLPTAGFRAARYQAGVPITVESPKDCPQVHQNMKNLCLQVDAFMRSSTFPVYDDVTKKGVWRLLVARRSVADDETMATIVVNLTGVEGTEEWRTEEKRLAEELSDGAQGEKGTKLVSLWVQEYAGVSSPDDNSPMHLVWGKERIEEELLGLRFTISPKSFFQVNTKGAEALYNVVIENLELGDDAVVLDVCCGAGTIGICAAAAGGAKKVYGSDLCLPAIEDARRNAATNGIQNCEFVCGKAEAVVGDQISKAFKQHKKSLAAAASETATEQDEGAGGTGGTSNAPAPELKFAAVVDPPRSGVHAKCLRSLRATQAIKRLVYVSCNPTNSLPADAVILCAPVSKATTGMPFRPVKAIPVDMFPHTPHIELVMVFERIEYEVDEPPAAVAKNDQPSSPATPTRIATVQEQAPAEAATTGEEAKVTRETLLPEEVGDSSSPSSPAPNVDRQADTPGAASGTTTSTA